METQPLVWEYSVACRRLRTDMPGVEDKVQQPMVNLAVVARSYLYARHCSYEGRYRCRAADASADRGRNRPICSISITRTYRSRTGDDHAIHLPITPPYVRHAPTGLEECGASLMRHPSMRYPSLFFFLSSLHSVPSVTPCSCSSSPLATSPPGTRPPFMSLTPHIEDNNQSTSQRIL